jgi:hypothetical protein
VGEMGNTYKVCLIKREGKRPLERPRGSGVYIVQMELKEMGWDCLNCSCLAQSRDQ